MEILEILYFNKKKQKYARIRYEGTVEIFVDMWMSLRNGSRFAHCQNKEEAEKVAREWCDND